jgi:hypothetical protein
MNQCKDGNKSLPPIPIQAKPDTVYLAKAFHDTITLIKKEKQYLPTKVRVYTKPDTLRRKALEHDTLITGLRMKLDKLEIQSITPEGINLVADYKLPEIQCLEMTIDHSGNLELKQDEATLLKQRRKARWRRAGNVALIITAFLVGVVV